jgi:glycosidase
MKALKTTAAGDAARPVLLVNRASRQHLSRAGLEGLHDAPIDLAAARRMGHLLGANGARLFLLAQLNAAIRFTCLNFLERHSFRPGWDTVYFAKTKYSFEPLGKACRSFQQRYQIREIPSDALHADGHGQGVEAARRQLVTAMCLLDIQSDNPAISDLLPLFVEPNPARRSLFKRVLDRLSDLRPQEGTASPWDLPLRHLLEAPVKAAPQNLESQVAYVLEHWRAWLPAELLHNLKIAGAIVREEATPRLPGPGPVQLPDYASRLDAWEPAAFSADTDWMPNAVILAKSIHVWMGQLSRQHNYTLRSLDQIPDAELDRLRGWGVNALWLIGIWERSRASRTIKQMRGNPEAEASAYALYSYGVAAELGGEAALANLERRCAERGIRLACDVVPNHTGIDSEWVQHHPDWFIQSDTPPYPSYRFSGPDLCENPDISVRIEEGYWDHSDAAVVFEYVDHRDGRHRFIYHGNDGTHLPWNDTAQLNFLLPEVRRAMSDLIVEIAKRFRLIRFDAAMTLARKHFRRLWYPPPGGSAGVASRSAFWMTDADFEKAFPVEFWREVVDRINREVPDTLLIAEAFWLMESYFVRNLGMHRVYNSAFMNLLKREENAKYRRILKDILAFNPEILKRYVNFMNNPDEATAVEQFGKGDKYFGTAVLLVTLPGLPMFGHGQIEGYREKYGMEFRRAYWDEEPDTGFIAHHEAQICPLLHRRHLFSDVVRFALYDLEADGGINENLFAYSNGSAQERCLVLYNNSAEPASGRLSRSAPKARPENEGHAEPGRALAEELGLGNTEAAYCRFRDHRSGLEHLRPYGELADGLGISLEAYQYSVFHDFRPLPDPTGAWSRLYHFLQGRAVANLDATGLRFLNPGLWRSTQEVFSVQRLLAIAGGLSRFPLDETMLATLDGLCSDFDEWVQQFAGLTERAVGKRVGGALRARLITFSDHLRKGFALPAAETPLLDLWHGSDALQGLASPLLCWQIFEEFMHHIYADRDPRRLQADFEHFGLDLAWQEALPEHARADKELVRLLLLTADSLPHPAGDRIALSDLIDDPRAQAWLGVNQHAQETWFDRDRMFRLCGAFVVQRLGLPTGSVLRLAADLERFKRRVEQAEAWGYRLDKFLALG